MGERETGLASGWMAPVGPTSTSGAFDRTRPVRVGPIRVAVESNDPEVVVRFQHLFVGFEPAVGIAGGLEMTVTITNSTLGAEQQEGLGYIAEVDCEVLLESSQLVDIELAVTRVLNDRKLAAEPSLLHLHSAAVAIDGLAVLLPAVSGSGKSTLTAALMQAGWKYITDEQVTLRPVDGAVVAYPRPITVRRPVWSLFPTIADVPVAHPDGVVGPRVEVSPAAFGAVHRGPAPRPAVVVFPSFVADVVATAVRIDCAAQVVELLTSCCYDLERLGLPGFELLVDLAARCPAWQLEFSDLVGAVSTVAGLFDMARVETPQAARHIAPPSRHPALVDGEVRCASTAHAWAFDDGFAVVYDPTSLRIAQLDAAGTEVWELLRDAHDTELLVARLSGADANAEHGIRSWLLAMEAALLLERGR